MSEYLGQPLTTRYPRVRKEYADRIRLIEFRGHEFHQIVQIIEPIPAVGAAMRKVGDQRLSE